MTKLHIFKLHRDGCMVEMLHQCEIVGGGKMRRVWIISYATKPLVLQLLRGEAGDGDHQRAGREHEISLNFECSREQLHRKTTLGLFSSENTPKVVTCVIHHIPSFIEFHIHV